MTAGRLWALTAVIVVLLIASVGFAAVRLGWHMGGHTDVLPLAVDVPQTAEVLAPQEDISVIVALAPFGKAAAIDQLSQTATARPKLDVALRGVLVDPDPEQSRAFVLVGSSTLSLRIGESIQAAELVAINADTITLKSEDGLQIVGFNGVLEGEDAPAEVNETPADNPTDPFARLAAAIVPGKGSIDLREAPPPETTEEYINVWRDRITKNPQAAMDSVGVELVENGYRIKPDPNIGVTLAGLRPGDVVTRLNGQAVGDLNSDRQLYDEVAAAGIARLEVVRDGQALLLTFPLR